MEDPIRRVCGLGITTAVKVLCTALAVTIALSGLGLASSERGRIKPVSGGRMDNARAAKLIARAMAVDPRSIRRAGFAAISPFSDRESAISTKRLAGFPRHGRSYGILSTGDATLADNRNTSGSSGAEIGRRGIRGARDVTILRIELRVPARAMCLSFRFRFLSEEFPEFVNTDHNDGFIAELDKSTWRAGPRADPRIRAPRNFANDAKGNRIAVNAVGDTSVSAARSGRTTYDGATRILRASTPVRRSRHTLYLSVFDQRDRGYDSAVFVDRLTLDRRRPCASGVVVD
jgi:hypothetical protein